MSRACFGSASLAVLSTITACGGTEPESRLLSASGVSSRPRSSIARVANSLLVTSSA